MHGYLITVFITYLLIAGFGYWLDYLNLSYLRKHGSLIPPEFEGHIDQGLLGRARDYTVEKARFGFISSIFHNIILLLFLFGGLLYTYDSWLASLNLHFILSGLLFFFLLYYAETILSLPFSLYRTFKIEKRYGFNTMTLRVWITDTIKSLAISTILMGLILAAGLFLIQKSPGLWWFWVWCFFLALGIFMMYISPYVIEPLFHKFTPIDDEELVSDIRNLLQKAGITVSRIFMMDASKRTRHTNAYFTGIGKVKRIVLYDTLIEKMDNDEILSVLAHEVGHWKKRHLLKHLILSECTAFIVMYISFRILQGDFLLDLFNIGDGTFFSRVVILGFLGSIASFPFSPILHYLSRRHEDEADRYSYELAGNAVGMISALVKLSKDNLSNLHPHPLYAIFHYSHPPVLKRIRRIRLLAG